MLILLFHRSLPKSSYYDKDFRATAALIRARRPFLVRNLVTGAGIFGFAIGVCKWQFWTLAASLHRRRQQVGSR